MSDTKSSNHRLECPYCNEIFLTKSYSSHILNKHLIDILSDKDNKSELEKASLKKEGGFNDPIPIKTKDKESYYTPCCEKFYAKESMAMKHRKNKECRDNYVKKVKELLENVKPMIVNNNSTHTGSGNINNITNFNFYDLSGNLIKTIVKEFTEVAENERYNKASYYKKLEKLRSIFQDHPDYDSDISSIKSGYDSDDESEATLSRIDFNKDIKPYNKKMAKQLDESKLDLSRKALGLRTKEDSIADKEEKIRRQKEEEQFEEETEQFELLERKANLKSEIISLKEKLNRYEKRHNEFLEMMKNPSNGITQDIFDKEFSQTANINKTKKLLETVQSELAKL